MRVKAFKTNYNKLFSHETKRHIFWKFLLVVLVFLGYFIFLSTRYSAGESLLAAALTWSFFVLCTPIADAGFLIDFPLRLITKIRMLLLETIVWAIAIGLSAGALMLKPEIFSKTKLLFLFQHILEKPFPFWGIIFISAIGTFVSIQFGDELLDKIKHEDRNFFIKHKFKHRLIVMAFLFLIAIIMYDFLLQRLGVKIPLF